jgi:hypothetical protein
MGGVSTITMKLFKTDHVAVVEDYPYGFMRTTVEMSLEFNPKHGFRSKFVSTNPKNGKQNKPKYSTYSQCMVMYENEEGHIKYMSFSLSGDTYFTKARDFLAENPDLFTPEQIQYIQKQMQVALAVSLKAICIYCGADFDKLKPLYDPHIKRLAEGIKNGENVIADINPDWDAINSHKVEGYMPFVTKTIG